ncbi:CTP synthase [Chloroflexota bacterium]
MPKYIFITGGVVSSVGKGIIAASIGNILKNRQINVSVQKLDPYLNVDPGTMSPYQHGEVFVTKDGAETDLDLGNYERFIDIELTKDCNITSGQVYSAVIAQERRGDFLGGTIQVVPHLTGEIKKRFAKLAEISQAEVLLIEVGGTVGDIEGQPFLEAIRQMRKDVGRGNVFYIHVTYLPYLNTSQELKTKPTQHSVNELRRIGIQPDVIICRSDYPISESIRDKISLFCDVEKNAVIPMPTADTIYEIPLTLEDLGFGELIVNKLDLKAQPVDLAPWRAIYDRIKKPREPLNIALVGKYVELPDAYFSVREALHHAALHHDMELKLELIHSEELNDINVAQCLKEAQGIIVPGGFGIRGIEGMIATARYARENKIPYLGLCLGLQVMVIEFARHVTDAPKANSTEFDPETPHPVIDIMLSQKKVNKKGGTMRLGNYPCRVIPGTLAAEAYKNAEIIQERHRHRFEFTNSFREDFAKAGMVFSGLSPDGTLVEMCEITGHPWMLSCQFHPEFTSRPGRPQPLFCGFIGAAKSILREGAQPLLPLNEKTK